MRKQSIPSSLLDQQLMREEVGMGTRLVRSMHLYHHIIFFTGALFSVVVSSESVSALLGSLLWPLLLPVMLDINILCNSGSIFFVMAGLDLIAAPLVL